MANDFTPMPPSFERSGLGARIADGIADYRDNVKLFNRNAWLYLIGSFLMGVNFQVFLVLLNLYLKEIGLSEGDIGLIASSRAGGVALMAIPAGILIGRSRLMPYLLASCVLFAVFSFFIVSLDTFLLMAGFSVLSGVAASFYRIAAGPFFMRNSTAVERTHLFSFNFGTNMLAGIIGAAGAGRLATIIAESSGDVVLGYQWTLYLGIAVSLLAIVPFAMIKSGPPPAVKDRIRFNRALLRKRGSFYGMIFVSTFFIGLGAGLTIPFLNLYFRDRFDLPPDTIGLYYSLVHVSMLIGSLAGPILTKKYGLVRTVVLTQSLAIPLMLVLSYSFALVPVVIAFIVRGGLMNLGWPIVNNLSMELATESERGLVNALLMVGWNAAWMISTALGGSLIEQYGYTVTINMTVVLYIISTLTFYWFFRNSERRNSNGLGWSIVRETQQ